LAYSGGIDDLVNPLSSDAVLLMICSMHSISPRDQDPGLNERTSDAPVSSSNKVAKSGRMRDRDIVLERSSERPNLLT
jgi:hypothetical protein